MKIRPQIYLVGDEPNLPYAMLLESDDFSTCSASPELFFSKREDHRDAANEKELANEVDSTKRIRKQGRFKGIRKGSLGNLMILDMVRNTSVKFVYQVLSAPWVI